MSNTTTMKVDQCYMHAGDDTIYYHFSEIDNRSQPTLILLFAERQQLSTRQPFERLKAKYPNADIIQCSTAGEIVGRDVLNNSIAATAIQLEKSSHYCHLVRCRNTADSFNSGKSLAEEIRLDGLKHILVFSDGHIVNGSDLLAGIKSIIPPNIGISGGMAADGADFNETLVGWNENLEVGNVVAIALYGANLRVRHGYNGGWSAFGVERTITRATGNVLYELDGKNALELYKLYLGEKSAGLPGTALLFPLSIQLKNRDKQVVRTILAINEEEGSMTFAGDVPVGTRATLMIGNPDQLVAAAEHVAIDLNQQEPEPDLAILVSCVGRKLLMKQRIEEEVEAVSEVFGPQTTITGFYSYGEFCPLLVGDPCELHNQTMTITTLKEG